MSRIAMLIVALLLAGCSIEPVPTEDYWPPKRVTAWIAQARAECKPHGQALDAEGHGYYVMREVLICPDGTLRIVPMPAVPPA